MAVRKDEQRELLVQRCMKMMDGLLIRPYLLPNLEAVFRHMAAREEKPYPVNYNIRLTGRPDQYDAFLEAFEKACGLIVPGYQLVKISEPDILKHSGRIYRGRNEMNLDGKYGVVIYSERERTLTPPEHEQWNQTVAFFESSPLVIRILYSEKNELRRAFENEDHIYYRVFPLEIAFYDLEDEDIYGYVDICLRSWKLRQKRNPQRVLLGRLSRRVVLRKITRMRSRIMLSDMRRMPNRKKKLRRG